MPDAPPRPNPDEVDWDTCTSEKHKDCIGVQLTPGGPCLTHASDEHRTLALAIFHAGANLDATRGCEITPELLEAVLASAPRYPDGQRVLTGVDLTRALLSGDATFDGTTFSGDATFGGATFSGDASFDEATFSGDAYFGVATFSGDASFDEATFSGDARFDGATFSGDASFDGATFSGTPVSFGGATFSGDASFDEATFSGVAYFVRATFSGDVGFEGATFSGDARFGGATFSGYASFDGATFSDTTTVSFGGSTFSDTASFDGATFSVYAHFLRATFSGDVGFEGATFSGYANFERATFSGGAYFDGATFSDTTSFGGSTFSGDARFDWVTFSGDARFEGVTFSGNARFEGVTFSGTTVRFGGATFTSVAFNSGRFELDQDLEVRCFGPVSFGRCSFDGRLDLDVRALSLDLSGASLGGPARLTLRSTSLMASAVTASRPVSIEDARSDHPLGAAAVVWFLGGCVSELSIIGSSVTSLARTVLDDAMTVGSGVLLGDCDLAGVHNLHRLRVTSMTSFDEAPHGGRRVLAAEQSWRRKNRPMSWWRPRRWLWREWQPPAAEITAQKPHEIAATYRELRVAREAAGDAPGAADLYYGEMEMRRHDPTRSLGERSVVWLYWLFGGYGLRVLRPLIALAVLLVGCTWLLDAHGFHQRITASPPPDNTLLFALNSALSVLRPTTDGPVLTQWGQVAEILLKVGVPLFLGLTLLSVRGRVKR